MISFSFNIAKAGVVPAQTESHSSLKSCCIPSLLCTCLLCYGGKLIAAWNMFTGSVVSSAQAAGKVVGVDGGFKKTPAYVKDHSLYGLVYVTKTPG